MLAGFNQNLQSFDGTMGGTLMRGRVSGILEEAEDEDESPAKIRLLESRETPK